MDLKTLGVAKKYTDKSIQGISGVLAGKNCKIESIEPVEGGNKVTFLWTADNGDTRRSTLIVMDGEGIPSGGTKDQILAKASDADGDLKWIDNQGGGGGGTNNYNLLSNLPQINGNELKGNKTTEDLIPIGTGLEFDEDGKLKATGGGGDSSIAEDITTNVEVGGIPSGTTIEEGTTLTELMKKMLVKEIAPTTTFTASGSGVKETGSSVTPTLTLVINSDGTGTPTEIEFYNGNTLVNSQQYVSGTNSYTYTMSAISDTTTVKGVLKYKKSDNTNGTVEKTATYTFVMASYYGAVTTAPTDKAGIVALTKNVKNTKAQTATFSLSNQKSCYCYPASFGDLTSIKDANNFDYINSYTKTTVAVDGVNYNVYTLTDPVTASGFKQIYA